MNNKKLAIVSDQVCGGIGGAESILFCATELFPEAPVYTTIYNPEIIPEQYKYIKFKPSLIQDLPFAKKHYKAYFPLMPLAMELLNLQEYDLIFSSHHSVAKGIIPRPDAAHVSYCHSPARYIWDLFWTYSDLNGFNNFKRVLVALISQYIRMWDVTSAQRVDFYLANSRYTASRIKKFYGRESYVLHPPVDTNKFSYEGEDDYYFMLGRLVAYKGYELAVDAFNASGKRLIIAGNGPEYIKLKAKAHKNVELLGRVSNEDVIKYMNNCKGFIFPGKEDFGIVMAEAQSAGKPVIAFNKGGACDIVINNETGILFEEQTLESLNEAIVKTENTNWNKNFIIEHAKKFDKDLFKSRLDFILSNLLTCHENDREEFFRQYAKSI
ncbi:MAG TPA: glycosyltransferase [Candidatus Gastranaerophilales bacterium]|nr:glycosyltransferase [Candidatus Gastranaerophilales bacterium]